VLFYQHCSFIKQRTMTQTKVVNRSLYLPVDAIEFLRKTARRRGCSMADVVRQTLSTEIFLNDKVKNGARIFIQSGSNIKELILP
jgi:hypothetical protein